MDDASRLPETFLAAVPPPHNCELDLPDRFALRLVGGVGLRADSDHVYRGKNRPNGCRGCAAGVLFDSAARDYDGPRRIDCPLARQLAGPPRHARNLLYDHDVRHLAGVWPRFYMQHNAIAGFMVWSGPLGLGGANFIVYSFWLPEPYSTEFPASSLAFISH